MWGLWSAFLPCNKSCDYGYQIRTRKCDDPSPKYNGMPCQGIDTHEVPGCNAFPCPSKEIIIIFTSCRKLGKYINSVWVYVWMWRKGVGLQR